MKSYYLYHLTSLLTLVVCKTEIVKSQVEIIPAGISSSHCMNLSSYGTYQYLDTIGGVSNYHWEAKGDIKIVKYNIDSSEIGIESHTEGVLRSPFGKGRLFFIYQMSESKEKDTVYYDVYKKFTAKDLTIYLPKKQKSGDTTTFAIEKIVSVNLDQNIGRDSYYWSFTPNLKRKIYSYAPDSSSVTLILDSISPTDSVFLDIGRCNLKNDFNYVFPLDSIKKLKKLNFN